MSRLRENRLKLSRRGFLATGTAASFLSAKLALRGGGRRVLTLVYDKAAGAMRAVDKVVR